MRGRAVEVEARAKLTLSLRVVDSRPDGYHDIEALAISVSEPHDVLTVSQLPVGAGVHLNVGGPVVDRVPFDASNLAVRAVQLLSEHVGVALDVELALHKRIPAEAGLGGGSMDAAAALVGVRDLFGLLVDDFALEQLAAHVGSDAAFGVRGGAAWMRGRGEHLERVTLPPLRALVAVPPLRCATADVYQAWDELGGPKGREVAAPAGLPVAVLANDLEPAALQVEPRLEAFRAEVERCCGRDALMAGSGSAYAALYDDSETPGRDAAEVRDATGADVYAAAMVDQAVLIHPA